MLVSNFNLAISRLVGGDDTWYSYIALSSRTV